MENRNQIMLVLLVLFSVALTGHAFKMERVMLAEGKLFLKLHEEAPTVLQCRYTMKEGTTVKRIIWYHDNALAFTWAPPEPSKLGEGLQEGDAVLTRTDGNLEFAKLRMDLQGSYRCEVLTSKGETYKSLEYQLLLVDAPDVPIASKIEVEDCAVKLTWIAPAINPKPTPVCGIYNAANQYMLTATHWQGIPYYNGSIAYRLDEEKFQINQMPTDSVIKCELGIPLIDGSYAQIVTETYNVTEVYERGCRPLSLDKTQHLEYENDAYTCRSELKPKNKHMPVKAFVTCSGDLVPKYSYLVTNIQLDCSNNEWVVGGGMTWNHYDNLICVEEESVPEPPPRKEPPKLEKPRAPKRAEENTSSAARPVYPWAIFVLAGLTACSGILWGLRLHFKKKDARHMA